MKTTIKLSEIETTTELESFLLNLLTTQCSERDDNAFATLADDGELVEKGIMISTPTAEFQLHISKLDN